MNTDIDYALVETTRPPIYTAMKYWGKKPHNIWFEYIQHYTPKNGIFLDPFCGSAMSAIESLKAGRKTIAFDLNPLSSFMIDVLLDDYDRDIFQLQVASIVEKLDNDDIYCRIYKYNNEYIHHVKINNNDIYEVGIIHQDENGTEIKSLRQGSDSDIIAIDYSNNIDFDSLGLYFPNEIFPNSDSFNDNFIKKIGGNNFKNIWTKRNLYVLAKIFDEIKKVESIVLQRQLLFGFIQTVHLCTKMNVPRERAANRPFSTSWGRSAYLCANKQMEQNPLLVFKGSCFGKQSVDSALSCAKEYIKSSINKKRVDVSNKQKSLKNYQLKYGVVDVGSLDLFLDEKSVDFILTDPPYGGLVQYLDLSYIWLVWLKNINPNYAPHFASEITVNRKIGTDLDVYTSRFTGALKQLYRVLKDDGKMVLTFHNKEIPIWNAFLHSIRLSGFKIEKVIHQQNLRAGESVVGNPYGTSGTDFYIRCVKNINNSFGDNLDKATSILNQAIQVIAERNEPTPYQILFNGVLANLSMSGKMIEDIDDTIENVLSKYVGEIFILTDNNKTSAGDLWWFINPRKYINYPDIPLSERVEQTVVAILREKGSVSLDEVLQRVFMSFPNGLTPDRNSVQEILTKYATKSNNKWVFQKLLYESTFTQHTKYIYDLIMIGKNLGYQSYIGRREQSEPINGNKLKDYADYLDLNHLGLNGEIKKRLEMIDIIWLKNGEMQFLIEVENSTTITSAIQRASNADNSIKRFIVIPDNREKELLNIRDEFFVNGFKDYGWSYITYTDVNNLINDQSKLHEKFKGIK